MSKSKPIPPQEYLTECFDYCEKTGVLTWKERPLRHFSCTRLQNAWNNKNAGNKAGCSGTRGYVNLRIDGIKYKAHRVIFKLVTNAEPEYVDHINLVTSDNRIENLRACTHSQNHQNTFAPRNNKLGLKGVRQVRSGKFVSRIVINGVRVSLGTYETPEDAYDAYTKVAVANFGKFARV